MRSLFALTLFFCTIAACGSEPDASEACLAKCPEGSQGRGDCLYLCALDADRDP